MIYWKNYDITQSKWKIKILPFREYLLFRLKLSKIRKKFSNL